MSLLVFRAVGEKEALLSFPAVKLSASTGKAVGIRVIFVSVCLAGFVQVLSLTEANGRGYDAKK
jgi:hypothetical protein